MRGRNSIPPRPIGTMCSADYPRNSVFNRLDIQKEDCDMPARLKGASTLTGIALIVVMILAVACSSTEEPRAPEQPQMAAAAAPAAQVQQQQPSAPQQPEAPAPAAAAAPQVTTSAAPAAPALPTRIARPAPTPVPGRTDQARRNSEDWDCPACSVPRSPQGWTCEQSQRVCRHVQLVD